MAGLWYDEFHVGMEFRHALTRTVTEMDNVLYCALTHNPQPLHLDEEAAKKTMIGRLCASGWHSCAILMRILCDSFLLDAASLGSPGLEEVKFLKPVFPGDRLSLRYTCNSKRPLASKPGIGLTRILFEMSNEAGDVVLTWDCTQLIGMRQAAGARP